MVYVGSKRRLMSSIGPIIAECCAGVVYEPFCGGLNATEWFVKSGLHVVASDGNPYLISLFNFIADGGQLPFVNSALYKDVRGNSDKHPMWLVAWAGIGCSYGAKWFGGYEDFIISKGALRNKQLEAKAALLRSVDVISITRPSNHDYRYVLPRNSTVYLDPPYANVSRLYRGEFDSDAFYAHCRNLKSLGNRVFISEYEMPSEFIEVWSAPVRKHPQFGGRIGIERLYTI